MDNLPNVPLDSGAHQQPLSNQERTNPALNFLAVNNIDGVTQQQPMSDADKKSMNIALVVQSSRDGVIKHVKNAIEQPVIFGAKVAGTAAFGAVMTRIAYENPKTARIAIPAMAGLMIWDLASRGIQTAAALKDTWHHPENYSQNKKELEEVLGGGIFDYGVYGAAAGFGVKTIQTRMETAPLKERMKLLWDDLPDSSVPVLKSRMAVPSPTTFHNSRRPESQFYFEHSPSVVQISGQIGNGATANGSGFYVDRNLVATSYHVVRGFDRPIITDHTGKAMAAKLIGRDVAADLAILRIARVPKGVTPQPVQLGDAMDLKAGQKLFNIGHPHGMERSVFGSGKFLEHDGVQFGNRFTADVGSSIPTRPGSSGSPVFDESGKVVSVLSSGTNDTAYGANVKHLQLLLQETRMAEPRIGEWLNLRTNVSKPGSEGGSTIRVVGADLRNRTGLARRFHDLSTAAISKQELAVVEQGWARHRTDSRFEAAMNITGALSYSTLLLNAAAEGRKAQSLSDSIPH